MGKKEDFNLSSGYVVKSATSGSSSPLTNDDVIKDMIENASDEQLNKVSGSSIPIPFSSLPLTN